MMQNLLVFVLFVLALGYTGWQLYSSFRPGKGGCAKGCGGCALDLSKLEEQLKKTETKL